MMNVVLNFHKKDQFSALLLLNILLELEEGIECKYYLQYGDHFDTIKIQTTIEKFLKSKTAILTNELPEIAISTDMINNDPNQNKYKGNHTIRSRQQKNSILQWNLCVYKYLQSLDHFLIIEPDCIVLKENWLKDIYEKFLKTDLPIFGHLKKGQIEGKQRPTHWAGCSVYRSKHFRNLDLKAYFNQRYENPWWKYRNAKDTTTSNNCFWGPFFSGYDISYDYFLFAHYWRSKTGSNDPDDWEETLQIPSHDSLILCDFHSKKDYMQIEKDYFKKLPLIHGIKDDQIRAYFLRKIREEKNKLRRTYQRSMPINDEISSRTNDSLETLKSLRNKYKGKRCFIIGNGPSLNKTDLRKLKNEYTIGLNRIYLNLHNMEFVPTFYCVVNSNVIEQFHSEVSELDTVKFIKSNDLFQNIWNTFQIDSLSGLGFNKNLLGNSSWHEGWTVTFCAMQLAYFLGFETVYLVGVDHYFKNSGTANLLTTAEGTDENHFHPEYFSEGVKWQFPDLLNSEKSYLKAKEAFLVDGRCIQDATIGGHLNIFPKVDYEFIFQNEYKKKPALSRLIQKSYFQFYYLAKKVVSYLKVKSGM